MINIDFNSFLKLKFSGVVPVTCDNCGVAYNKTKRQLYHNNRLIKTLTGFSQKNSCSKNCQSIIQHHRIRKTCVCGKAFETVANENSTYCSKSCANSQRIQSEETKVKIRNAVKQYNILHPKPAQFVNCIVCNSSYEKNRNITCSKACRRILHIKSGTKGGRISASKMVRRSKSEIALYDLLSNKYKCLSNQTMFNGWDADIIIPDLKLAILWNGIWHYSKVKQSHSVKQVQTRDWIKINEIQKCGYHFIIVKDYKNKMTPNKAYDIIENHIANDIKDVTIL